jgi:glycine C-acetyltransferase
MAYPDSIKQLYIDTLALIEANGLTKRERMITAPQGSQITVSFPAGQPPRSVINMCSNNYLGLSDHPDVVRAAHEALDTRGYGMSSVRFICGTQDIHLQLERELTAFLGTEDTILFSSCFDANGAVFETLLDEKDIMISDRLVHASIVDGMRLSKATHDTYKHGDVAHLRRKLEEHRDHPRTMIITDGVFSMDGDVAPLREIVELAEEFRAMVFVDDSHATGFMGTEGRGTHEYAGVLNRIDIISTTFGKALGGASGGCLAGRKELVDLLRQRGRPYLFSNTLAPVITQTTLQVLRLVRESAERRERLHANTRFWRKALQDAGFVLKDGATPIVPVMLYNAKLAQQFSTDLYESGVYAVGFFFPVVAQGQARIRTQLSAAHSPEQLQQALDVFIAAGRKYGILGLSSQEIIARFGQ